MEDPIAELVDWQLSNQRSHRSPDFPNVPVIGRCPHCQSEWHGLGNSLCGGSHLSQVDADFLKGKCDTPARNSHNPPRGIR